MEVPLLINDFLRRAAKLYPDKTAIVDGDLRFTYREFQERVEPAGARAAAASASSRATASASSARTRTSSSRATTASRRSARSSCRSTTGWSPADHEYIINHAGVKAVLVDHEYTGVVDEIRPSLTTVEHWIVAQDDGATRRPAGRDWEALIARPAGDADAARRAGRERRRRRSTTPPARRRGRRA